MSQLAEPLALRSGQVLPNRIAKAAMEEFLAVDGQLPGPELVTLYRRWGGGGAGLLITGHVMVDERALANPSDVVLADRTPLEPFRRWAAAATAGGARAWMQINHPGRVVYADMPGLAWSASDIPVSIGRLSRFFAQPTAMTPEQIDEVVDRFGRTAQRAVEAGFDGVEIHAAHGYLISQFLSPLTNRRTDRWGGDLGNRARLLIDVVTEVRRRLPDGAAVAVKLNTADFQRGGFGPDDARQVVGMLADAGVDLVELSGGSVESLATNGYPADGHTLAREAYFLDAAATIIPQAPVPVMLTGGVRRRAVAERVRAQGAAVVGVATALAVDPELPRRWLRGEEAAVAVPGPALEEQAPGLGGHPGRRALPAPPGRARSRRPRPGRPGRLPHAGAAPATPVAAALPPLAGGAGQRTDVVLARVTKADQAAGAKVRVPPSRSLVSRT